MKYPEAYELPSDEGVDDLLAICADAGVTLLDTAPAYGTSEDRLGPALARRGDRDRWVLSTKVGEAFDGEVSRFDFTPEAVVASVERSLRRLGTDRVEIVLVHSNGVEERRLKELGTLDALAELRSRGLLRAVGVSVKTQEGADHAIEHGVDCLMIEYNPAATHMAESLRRCHDHGVGVLLKKALASGHLAKIGGDPSADPIELALAFAFEPLAVSSVVIGTANPAHLRANLAAAKRVLGGSS